MDGFISRKVLKGRVYHDGTQMIVLNEGKSGNVPIADVKRLEDEGVIAKVGGASKPSSKARRTGSRTTSRKRPSASTSRTPPPTGGAGATGAGAPEAPTD